MTTYAVDSYHRKLRTHVVKRGFLSVDDCNHVVKVITRWEDKRSKIQRSELLSGTDSRIDRLYERFAEIAEDVNTWGVHLQSISRPLVVNKLLAGCAEFRPHVDFMPHKGEYDKLAMVTMLVDRSSYVGGEMVFDNVVDVKLNKGDMVVFPGYMVHRVKPVTSGMRMSLVCWVSGPAFV